MSGKIPPMIAPTAATAAYAGVTTAMGTANSNPIATCVVTIITWRSVAGAFECGRLPEGFMTGSTPHLV
jgi:hypothetical protein